MTEDVYESLESEEIEKIIELAIREFSGYTPTLEAAIGALFVGRTLGWEVLYIIHNRSTLKKFEAILRISFQKRLPKRTPQSPRNYAWAWANKFKVFWKVIRGDIKVEGRTGLRTDPVSDTDISE